MNTLSETQATALILETLEYLRRAELIQSAGPLGLETAIVGDNSPLDSLAVVTFIDEVEARVRAATGQNTSLIVNDIAELETGNTPLTAGLLAAYLVRATTGAHL